MSELDEFEQWWANANPRLTDLPKSMAKMIWEDGWQARADQHKREVGELVYALQEAHWLIGKPENPDRIVAVDGKMPRSTSAVLSINAALSRHAIKEK